MYSFKIFPFGDELHGETYHLLMRKILKNEYQDKWQESITEIDNIYWINETDENREKIEKIKFNRYRRYEKYYLKNQPDDKPIIDRLSQNIENENKLFKWDFCSESAWSKIAVIIPEIFFLDSKAEMTKFFNKTNYKATPVSRILDKKYKIDKYKKFLNKRVFIKSGDYSVYKAKNKDDNHSGNAVKVYHNLTEKDLLDETSNNETKVIQNSIEPLFLFRKKKFDIRYHILFVIYKNKFYVFSHNYNFCRLAINNYDKSSVDKADFITNYNLQGISKKFKVENCQVMSYKLPNYEDIEKRIQDSVIELVKIIKEKIVFKRDDKPKIWLTGFDFILDDNKTPWLLEINHNPGFTVPYPKNKYEKVNVEGVRSLIDFFIEPMLENKPLNCKNCGVFNYLFSFDI